jgi:hypothetical protein
MRHHRIARWARLAHVAGQRQRRRAKRARHALRRAGVQVDHRHARALVDVRLGDALTEASARPR